MKTNSAVEFKSKALTPSQVLLSSLLASAVLVTGCQSTGFKSQNSNSTVSKNTPSAAKEMLAQALQKQRRDSFSYHSNVEISNNQSSKTIDAKQLTTIDRVEQYCEQTHDEAYATLLAEAETNNKELAAIEYDTRRQTLQQTFEACDKAYRAWDNNQYYSPAEAELKSPVSPYYQQLFDGIEAKTSTLDIKKSQLLDEYLFKPLSINAQGVYQPLAGKFTMLMSAQYQARNNFTTINQPIYIDFKTGTIYLWADNFALINSEFADDKLGTKWQNKWLKLAIDDGSLPKGFGKAVIKAHFEALDRTYEAAPIAQFDNVMPNSLVALSPKLPASQLNAMTSLPNQQIIRRVQSAENYEQFYKDYISIFYERITSQYPELIKTESSYQSSTARPDSAKLTSKVLVQQVLAMMKRVTDLQADNVVDEVFSASVTPENQQSISEDKIQQPNIELLYGLNQRGQLQWQHQRIVYEDSKKRDKGVTVDVLQQYMPISSAVAFPNLPTDRQTPNASNSIDIRQYGSELMDYYREGNGTAIGKMLYSSLPVAKALYSSMTEPTLRELEQDAEDSVDVTEEIIEETTE